ncbi:hypothetical protein ADK57_32695 [Streptomyces sp. MMG1533]|uniref:hypothetical protein n=1 Tax=Streptomyces sp. MMG1533 TaxID=1415546 RepID=UPI0006AFE9CF|nr:hypothetical protein [Streptomyces sp. MMG1533]KOU59658.1 hypothetical protein ADK57_32695 [Streptomyces sp. MMG1533]
MSGRNPSSTISSGAPRDAGEGRPHVPGLGRQPVHHVRVATGIVRQLGGSFGTAVLAAVPAPGHGTGAFAHAFLWSTAFTVVAALVGIRLPIRLASAEPRP